MVGDGPLLGAVPEERLEHERDLDGAFDEPPQPLVAAGRDLGPVELLVGGHDPRGRSPAESGPAPAAGRSPSAAPDGGARSPSPDAVLSVVRGFVAGVEGAAPPLLGGTARVLARLGVHAEVAQVAVQGALQLALAGTDDLLHPRVAPLLAQLVELDVRVEYEGGPSEAPRETRARRVQPDDEKGPLRKTEREPCVLGVRADGACPAVVSPILLVQTLQLSPQQPLELGLVGRVRSGEAGHEGGELAAELPLLLHEA